MIPRFHVFITLDAEPPIRRQDADYFAADHAAATASIFSMPLIFMPHFDTDTFHAMLMP